jgi:hypothetical protein
MTFIQRSYQSHADLRAMGNLLRRAYAVQSVFKRSATVE